MNAFPLTQFQRLKVASCEARYQGHHGHYYLKVFIALVPGCQVACLPARRMGGWLWRSCWQVRINYERKAERGMVLLGVSLIHTHSATRTHLHPHLWAQVAAQTLSLSLSLSLSHIHAPYVRLRRGNTKKQKAPKSYFSLQPVSPSLLLFPVYLFPFIEDKKRRRIDEERLSIVGRSRKPMRGKERRRRKTGSG